MSKGNLLLASTVLSTISIAAGLPSAAYAQTSKVQSVNTQNRAVVFNIEEQELSSALIEFNNQSGVIVVAPQELLRGKKANPISGAMSPGRALNLLLSGAGLRAKELPNGGFTIMAAAVSVADGDDSESPAAGEESIVVIGTRIEGADPTQRVEVITREDIEASGASTVEDALRRVQSNVASVNSFSSGQAADRENLALGPVPDGVSGVNLRGLGTENTLVLINGRRVAGVAGNDSGFTNISNIPLSAVERIEVLPDGASAAYGSDAIGGVVNIVLRSNYSGLSVTGRYERSNNSADQVKFGATYGTGWGSGRLTATASYNRRQRIRAADAGFTTNFYPGIATDSNGDTVDLDFTRVEAATGGAVERRTFTFFPVFMVINQNVALPGDNDGLNVTAADFVPVETVSRTLDSELIPTFLGPDEESFGFTFDISQDISSDLEVFATAFYSQNETFRDSVVGPTRIRVGATNAFNPFGTDIFVRFRPLQEFTDGILEAPSFSSRQRQYNFNAGLRWNIVNDLDLEVSGGFSRSASRLETRNRLDSFADVLNSPDPSVALNALGNGTAQNPSAIQALYGVNEVFTPATEIFSIEPVLRGNAFEIWGGDVKFAVGGDYREERLSDSPVLSSFASIENNKRESFGLFAEANFPLISPANQIPGVHSFSVSVQARYDEYHTEGPNGADIDQNPIIENISYNSLTPRVGFAYRPIEDLKISGSWGESFRAPSTGDLFGVFSSQFDQQQADPFAPGGPAIVTVPFLSASGNVNLRPEQADNYSLGLDFTPSALPGLRFRADWSRVEFTDRIVNGFIVRNLLSASDDFLALPGVAERDAMGNLTRVNIFNLNLDSRIVETIQGDIEYVHDTQSNGEFTFGISALHYLEHVDQISEDTDPIELLGTSRGPVEYKLTGHAGWRGDNAGVDIFVNYTPSNINDFNQVLNALGNDFERLNIEVPSYTTVDLTGYYDIEKFDLKIGIGVRNLFDADFPISPTASLPYDPVRVDPRGRVAFLELTKSF